MLRPILLNSVITPLGGFGIVLYTGNSAADRAITGLGFQPDNVWFKKRSTTSDHIGYDAERGVTKQIKFNSASAETTTSSFGSFDTDGFTLGSSATALNNSGDTYVAWCWGGGESAANTDGTLSSNVTVLDGKFSIVTYTGNSTGGATVGHGLGATPGVIIVRDRNGTGNWRVFHTSLGATKNLILDGSGSVLTDSSIWNDTAPTSTVFTLGSGGDVNLSGDPHIAYCFTDDSDFCDIGTYTGNGSTTGPVVTTGFQPDYVLIKRSDSSGDWILFDSSRSGSNPRADILVVNSTAAETTTAGHTVDFNATDFQPKGAGAGINANTGTYVYIAFKAV